jgi:hypothetical protein
VERRPTAGAVRGVVLHHLIDGQALRAPQHRVGLATQLRSWDELGVEEARDLPL